MLSSSHVARRTLVEGKHAVALQTFTLSPQCILRCVHSLGLHSFNRSTHRNDNAHFYGSCLPLSIGAIHFNANLRTKRWLSKSSLRLRRSNKTNDHNRFHVLHERHRYVELSLSKLIQLSYAKHFLRSHSRIGTRSSSTSARPTSTDSNEDSLVRKHELLDKDRVPTQTKQSDVVKKKGRLKELRSPTRITIAYKGMTRSNDNKREQERRMRPSLDGSTWEHLLEELRALTPPSDNSQYIQSLALTDEEACGSFSPGRDRVSGSNSPENALSSDFGDDAESSLLSQTDYKNLEERPMSPPQNFNSYIEALVLRNYPLKNHRTDVNVATQLLLEAFHDIPGAANLASLGEYHMALVFLLRHRKLPEARELFAIMERSKCEPTIATFNIFILDAANELNAAAFYVWLKRLHHHGFAPDCSTWVALLQLAPTTSAKQKIAWEIHQRQLVRDRQSAILLFRKLVPFSFDSYLKEGGDAKSFVKTSGQLFGPVFEDTFCVRQMLYVLASHGRFNEGLQLLTDFETRGYRPGTWELNVFLLFCYKHTNADAAIMMFNHAYQAWKAPPSKATMKHLFRVFWRARMFNTTWVTWAYAGMWNLISIEMKRSILSSMTQSLGSAPDTVRGRWQSSAAPVVLGSELTATTTKQDVEDPVKDLMTRDITEHGTRIPLMSLADMLLEAHQLDQTWTKNGIRKSTGTRWKIEHKLRIPVRLKGTE